MQTDQLSATAQTLADRAAHMMALLEKFKMRRSSPEEREEYERRFGKSVGSTALVPVSAKRNTSRPAAVNSPARPVRTPAPRPSTTSPGKLAVTLAGGGDDSFEEF